MALRAYGPAGKTGFDYDLSGLYQFGEIDDQTHNAWAATVDVGYTFEHAWKPRVGVFYGYVSGDRNPNDSQNNRFDRLFGFARPWSSNDYIQMENVSTPKVVVAFEPVKEWKIDTAYVAYWLASRSDRWNAANLSDPTGNSGDFLGHEYNVRMRFPIVPRIKGNIGYAYFEPGRFPSPPRAGRRLAFRLRRALDLRVRVSPVGVGEGAARGSAKRRAPRVGPASGQTPAQAMASRYHGDM